MLHETHVVTACNCPVIDLILCAELRNDRLIDVTKLLSDSGQLHLFCSCHGRGALHFVWMLLAMCLLRWAAIFGVAMDFGAKCGSITFWDFDMKHDFQTVPVFVMPYWNDWSESSWFVTCIQLVCYIDLAGLLHTQAALLHTQQT